MIKWKTTFSNDLKMDVLAEFDLIEIFFSRINLEKFKKEYLERMEDGDGNDKVESR